MHRMETPDSGIEFPENEVLDWGEVGFHLVERGNSEAWIRFKESDLVEVER